MEITTCKVIDKVVYKYLRPNSTDFLEVHSDIIDSWGDDRKNIARMIRYNFEDDNNIWKKIIPYDKYCKSCLGKNIHPFIKNKSCIGCYCISNVYVNGIITSNIFTIKDKRYIITTKVGILNNYSICKFPNILG